MMQPNGYCVFVRHSTVYQWRKKYGESFAKNFRVAVINLYSVSVCWIALPNQQVKNSFYLHAKYRAQYQTGMNLHDFARYQCTF